MLYLYWNNPGTSLYQYDNKVSHINMKKVCDKFSNYVLLNLCRRGYSRLEK